LIARPASLRYYEALISEENMSVKQSTCVVEDWGLIEYAQAYRRQKDMVNRVIAGENQRLILCEHPAVLTLGRMTKPENILWPEEDIEASGVKVIAVDRGGDITLHSPGQLIVYPIFNLNDYGRDLKVFFGKLEQVVIDLLTEFDILAGSIDGQRGVWVDRDKIASMGIGVRRWVTYHGIGINVNTDLGLFSMIRPCGLDVQMTSIQEIKGQPVDMNVVKQKLIERFEDQFKLRM
jgi:lipoate-protein ligase B